ncbi:MAG: tetraacyldisaccharide 4'-kinase [Muribaculaceae bacterium]|nr:tetraacyldisaccharide 4'-kinase [Muribaculaceae bacterium]
MTTETRNKILTYVLKPLSWIYGGVVAIRNWMFNVGILKEEKFDIPVVSIGNITVGGTGKTPHTEYVIDMLASEYKTAVLSRGYKRKTKGFLLANFHSTPESIGDEPLQIYNKFGSRVKVAVCESRRKGIRELLKQYPELELIVLDDAFQHRYVKPKVSVLLMDYNRPIYEDHLLPLGRLRESMHQINRADMVIVTKCPRDITPLDFRLVQKKLDLMSFQKLYFSRYIYGGLLPVFPDDDPYGVSLGSLTSHDTVLLVTGIANPRGFVRYFRSYPFKVKVHHFPDHHNFSRYDLEELEKTFNSLPGERKIIMTTEKDAVRLSYNPYYPNKLKPLTFFMPIAVNMVSGLGSSDFILDLKKQIDEAE